MRRSVFIWPCVLVIFVMASATSYGQLTTGSIYGKVMDAQGGVLPGVDVTLESVLIAPKSMTSSGLGVYRFPALAPGTYSVTFKLDGFKPLRREDLPVSVGATIVLDVVLKVGGIEEVVTVAGESPVVDTRHTNIGNSLDLEMLENVPSSRDPWTVLSWVPGIAMDRINVGGTESGQQSTFSGHGSSGIQGQGGSAQWSIDGVVITDMAATGGSSTYYDFDSIEEMEVSTGGHDAQVPYGNIAINFVTKQGGNDYRGQASFYGTNESLQSSNTPDTPEFDDVLTNQVNKIRDWGFDIGGPIAEDKAWFFGAFRTQDISITALSRNFEPGEDKSTLETLNFKVHGMVTPNTKVTASIHRNNKVKLGRGSGATRPVNTTWDQSGPSPIYKVEAQHTFGDNLLVSGSYGYVGGGFQLIAKGGRDVPVILDLATGIWENTTFIDHFTSRPQNQVRLDGNFYLSEAMGGDHEFKFGFLYRDTSTTSASIYGNGNTLFTNAGEPFIVYRNRQGVGDPQSDYSSKYAGFYFGDTFSKDRLTLNLNVRYDIQTSTASASSIEADTVFPDLAPAISFDGSQSGTDWTDISPRIGLTYDISGTGKTILRGNFATYATQRDQGNPDRFLQTTGIANFGFLCFDPVCGPDGGGVTSRDQVVDLNEDGIINADDVIGFSGLDPFNPGPQIFTTFDPDFHSPKSLEVIAGVQHELMPDFALGGNFIYRKNWDLLWDLEDNDRGGGAPQHIRGGEASGNNPGAILRPEDFQPVTEDGITWFELKPGIERGAGVHVENRPDFSNRYFGVEVTARKRMSNNWMLDSSFTYRDWTTDYECLDAGNPTAAGATCYQDPTNPLMLDDQWFFQDLRGSGKSRVFLGSKWQFKLGGMYQFPYGINVGAFLQAQQGNALPKRVRVSSARRSGLGNYDALQEPFGDVRLANVSILDLRIEKSTDMGFGTLSLYGDLFNALNSNTIIGQDPRVGAIGAGGLALNSFFDTPLEIFNPRLFRVGLKIRF